jgi:hypothetical protein
MPRLSVCWGFVDGVLGSTAYVHHFTSGFTRIRLQKEAEVEKWRGNGYSAGLGQALLDLSVIALQQGETLVADACIKEALALPGLSDETEFQLLSYHVHCRFMHFRYSTSRQTFRTEELSAFMDFEAELPKWQSEISTARSKVSSSSMQILSCVLSLQRYAWSARSVQTALDDPGSRHGLFSARAEQDIEYFTNVKLDKQILEAAHVDLADTYHAEGQPEKANKTIAKLITGSQDDSCLGSCYMIMGDWKAASYSVPEVWNMFPLQGVNSNAQPREREWQEFKTRGLDTIGARAEYNTAKQYFESIGHERGLGSVELRLAYLNTIEASSHPDKASRYRKALEHASLAKEKFCSAADWAGYYLACAHVDLCKIGTGQMALDKDKALEIGRWGRTKGSWSFVAGIGLFITRYARRWQIAEGDYERSLAALGLAEALFSELSAPLSHAYSLTDIATVFEALGDRTRFFIFAARALERCIQPLYAPFHGLERWLYASAEYIIIRMITRAIRLANPDDIERAAKNTRRLLEARSNTLSAALGQNYNGMLRFALDQPKHLLISATLTLSGLSSWSLV